MSLSEKQPKSSQATLDRVKAWTLANPERAKANRLRHYLKTRPPLKPVLSPLERFERLYVPVPEARCWLWTGACDSHGYGKAKVGGRDVRAHRWAWQLHRGEIPDGICVLHRCDVPTCVNPEHLFVGTNQDNVDDRERKGRGHVMPIHRETKLSNDDVLEIRRLRGVVTQVGLSKRFGVHHSQISRIQRGECFAHLGGADA